jgi:uncharacterized protein YbcI
MSATDDHQTPQRATAVDGREPSVLLRVSNEMVRIYKETFGRGPTKARTNFAGPDTIICTLENTFTPAEIALAKMDEHQRLRDTRMFFQYASEDAFRGSVEQVTGRKVRSFISGLDTRTDVAAEIFYLEPVEQ